MTKRKQMAMTKSERETVDGHDQEKETVSGDDQEKVRQSMFITR